MLNLRFRSLLAGAAMAAVLAVSPALSHAQEAQEPARDAAYMELLGNGLLYTVNYDRKLSDHVSGRIGLMAFGAVAVPVMGNYLAGGGNHRLELGAGPLLVIAGDIEVGEGEEEVVEDARFLLGTATFGYRYQPVNGGFLFRIGFTPVFGGGGGIPWAGVSFGYAF